MNTSDFFNGLARYKYRGDDCLSNWDELNALFAQFPDRPLKGAENVLAVNLILESSTHNSASCLIKAFDLANDLREQLQQQCQRLLQRTRTDLEDYLLLLIEHFAVSDEHRESSGIDSWISFGRPWLCHLVEGTAREPELRIFNKDAPELQIETALNRQLLRFRDPGQLDYLYILGKAADDNTRYWLTRNVDDNGV